ncbi:MAG: hypothetical protein K2W88_07855 [Pararheinheimera sp.]|nr:hypothetical protein [Rheinheimera sp.]
MNAAHKNRKRGDGFFIPAAPPLQSCACAGRYKYLVNMNKILILLLLFLVSNASSNDSNHHAFKPMFEQSCGIKCNYTLYWSRKTELGDPYFPLPPVVGQAKADFEYCEKLVVIRYPEIKEPTELLRQLMVTECMNSRGWFLKIMAFSTFMGSEN